MPATEQCTPCCTTTAVNTNIPGDAGSNCYTTTGENLTLVASPTTTNLLVGDSNAFGVGQVVFITDGVDYGHFRITGIPDSTHLTLLWLDYDPDAVVGSVIGSGAKVSPSGPQPELTDSAIAAINASLLTGINALTDNSTGTASDTIAAGAGVQTLAIFVNLAQITATTIFSFTPGFAFKVLAIQFSSEIAVTTAAKAATLTPTVNGSGVTGGALALTSANCTPKGTTVSGSAITGGNTGTSSQTLGIAASSVTTFSEGTGWVLLRIQNLDSANAIASLAEKINDIRSALIT